MNLAYFLIIATLMFGFGLATIMSRESLLGILVSIFNSMLGVAIYIASLRVFSASDASTNKTVEPVVFVFIYSVLFLAQVVVGCVLVWKRYKSSSVYRLTEDNELKN